MKSNERTILSENKYFLNCINKSQNKEIWYFTYWFLVIGWCNETNISEPTLRLFVYDWNMSHKSFSILAFPMIFSKKVFSIRWALPKRKLAKSIKSLPNLVVLLGELDSIWFLSMAKAYKKYEKIKSELFLRKTCR